MADTVKPDSSRIVAEVIAIGDELVSGQRLDTNSQWLSVQLGQIGIQAKFHTTVGDELEPIVQVLREAAHRCDVVIVTGGLGPTADDLTREALAAVAGVDLVFHEPSLLAMEERFRQRGREMPPNNRKQAFYPAGATIIPNPNGTAPGLAVEIPAENGRSTIFYALPGVPAEMKPMWNDRVLPDLRARFPHTGAVIHRSILCFGAGESDIENRLPDLIRRGRSPLVGITASSGVITLRITANGSSAEDCEQQIRPVEQTIRKLLGDLVFGTGEESLAGATIALLRQRGRTLAAMDAGTGGLLLREFSQADQNGEVFRGGVVDESGSRNLVDECEALQRSRGVAIVLGLGPDRDTEQGPRRDVVIVDGETTRTIGIRPFRNSVIADQYACLTAINLLRKELLRAI